MEWIRISDNKLKIMLTAEDAKRYALRCETMDLADSFTRKAFREILSDIRSDTGFDATKDKVYIQMYPSKEGGCELFVTKMGLLYSESEPCISEKEETNRPSRAVRRALPKSEIYSFPDLSSLLSVCLRLLKADFPGESAAWRDNGGTYWLQLTERAESAKKAPCRIPPWRGMLTEYGRRENAEHAKLYLSEHGHCVCPVSAVEILGMLN